MENAQHLPFLPHEGGRPGAGKKMSLPGEDPKRCRHRSVVRSRRTHNPVKKKRRGCTNHAAAFCIPSPLSVNQTLPARDLKVPAASITLLTSIFKVPAGNFKFASTNFQFQTANIMFEGTSLQFPITDIVFARTNLHFPITKIMFAVGRSNLGERTSNL